MLKRGQKGLRERQAMLMESQFERKKFTAEDVMIRPIFLYLEDDIETILEKLQSEEIWEQLGNKYSVFTTSVWPNYDAKYLVADTIKIGVQFNGKIRGDIEINKETTQEEVMEIVKSNPKISIHLTSEPKKIIYIPGRILNIVM